MYLSVLLVAAIGLASSASAQDIVYDSIHNFTAITGTWSSGSQHVVPGPGFANPAQETFQYPNTTGVGYSFSDDGWYEIARYRFASNATDPNCIIGTVVWAHGHYDLVANGSIILTPVGDGYQQVQAACAATSNFIQNYNFTELFVSWRIFEDPTFGPKLHLFQFDGSPVAPLFQVSTQPNMLPKQVLRNVTAQVVTTTSAGLVSTNTLAASSRKKRSGAAELQRPVGIVAGLVALAMLSTLL
ncbi:chaperone for protein-folding within the ER, fungal-domain-containing protein [Roridomyces roridus]|uniref:Chaperone for protein-folding within the ER, fungal-domain-containing protein n=1 Tax=Roridomyces roridus TaxID=1738132 RepID=A0AAD7CJZ4_9AGAR|nr:chaperone for protein-folding within the ER, fungal-domain-containing protein [Roridomyces roridus]